MTRNELIAALGTFTSGAMVAGEYHGAKFVGTVVGSRADEYDSTMVYVDVRLSVPSVVMGTARDGLWILLGATTATIAVVSEGDWFAALDEVCAA